LPNATALRYNVHMANAVTLGTLDKKIDQAIEDLSEIISQFAQTTHEEFVSVRHDIADLKASHDKLLNTLDHFPKRLDDIEADNTARDAQFARLERWIEQHASKTGLKLEY
jgi:septal ring factor EnvC (AmiA/AmiB activator)